MKGPAEVAHGPMFIGFTINVLLYGIMIIQVYLYYTTYKKDRTWMKLLVMFLLVCDTANTIFDFTYLYKSLILRFGQVAYLQRADWLFATDPAITGITASLVQLFFAWRVFVLTRSWPLAAVVFVGSLSGAAGSIATSFEVGRTPEFVNFRRFKGVVIMWLASESVTDIVITSILVWYLVITISPQAVRSTANRLSIVQRSHKTGFKQSDYMIDRIIRITVQTGMLTSVVATLDLITFLTDPTGTHLIFNFPLCKLYTNSLMSSLNSRKGWNYAKNTSDNTTNNYSETRNTEGKTTPAGFIHFSPPSSARTPPTSPGFYANPLSFAEYDSGVELDDFSNAKSSDSSELPSPISKPAAALHTPPNNRVRPRIFVQIESHQERDNIYLSSNVARKRSGNMSISNSEYDGRTDVKEEGDHTSHSDK